MAPGAEEGRGKRRNAVVSRKQAVTHRYPNGAIRRSKASAFHTEYIGMEGEPPELKHLSRERKRKQKRFRK